MRLKEIREINSKERINKIKELRTELSRLKTMTKAGGAVENYGRIKELKKTIARILTIENEDKITKNENRR